MRSPYLTSTVARRAFLKRFGVGSLGIISLERILTDPYAFAFSSGRTLPIKIRGAVKSAGKGLRGVAVSDGRKVITTNADGTFEFVSDGNQQFVFISLPAAYEIPTNPTGTARFYEEIPSDKETMYVQWDLKQTVISDDNHGFLLLADPQTLDVEDMNRLHAETVPDIQTLLGALATKSMFAVGCGDLMFNDLKLFPQYEEAIKKMGIPGFQVLGNHDLEMAALSDEAAAATFFRHFGPSYYSFNRGEVHYVVLDDVFWHGDGYIGYVEQTQLDWLKADLALIEKGRTVAVFTHIPPYDTFDKRTGQKSLNKSEIVTNREAVYRLLEGYQAHIIVGHMHETEHLVDHGIRIHVGGAVCGAWWTGDICHDGTPNGYPVYEVKGSELRWQYKSTGHPLEHQMRLYKRGSDPNRPDDTVANVWDADADWKIVWYEGGERKGLMTQGRGFDPRSVLLHSGDSMPKKHTWVEPVATDHLFYAHVSPNATETIVEATDKSGRVYTGRA